MFYDCRSLSENCSIMNNFSDDPDIEYSITDIETYRMVRRLGFRNDLSLSTRLNSLSFRNQWSVPTSCDLHRRYNCDFDYISWHVIQISFHTFVSYSKYVHSIGIPVWLSNVPILIESNRYVLRFEIIEQLRSAFCNSDLYRPRPLHARVTFSSLTRIFCAIHLGITNSVLLLLLQLSLYTGRIELPETRIT